MAKTATAVFCSLTFDDAAAGCRVFSASVSPEPRLNEGGDEAGDEAAPAFLISFSSAATGLLLGISELLVSPPTAKPTVGGGVHAPPSPSLPLMIEPLKQRDSDVSSKSSLRGDECDLMIKVSW